MTLIGGKKIVKIIQKWNQEKQCTVDYTMSWKFSIVLHFCYQVFLLGCGVVEFGCGDSSYDLLQPYNTNTHGSILTHRQIRDCQPIKYGPVTYQLHQSHSDPTSLQIETKYFTIDLGSKWVKGHYTIIPNPLKTLSVLEPNNKGGCKSQTRATVVESAKQKNCIVAMNGGFFHTSNGKCLGNVVSDGIEVQDAKGIQNAQFGILKNGSLFTGYLSEEDSLSQFQQLVSGIIWIIRNNETYIQESKIAECADTQETGQFETFINVISARTAVGHDMQGRVILLQVDGKTSREGVNLWEVAQILRNLGAVNAINLDGGGSATYVVNNTVVNYPSDTCEDSFLNCARQVTTILCAHEAECDVDCGDRGVCKFGKCSCHEPWSGTTCSVLPCHLYNCSGRGECTVDGCVCDWGWTGNHCQTVCKQGTWGPKCAKRCSCQNGGLCSPFDGSCSCLPGYIGNSCERKCPKNLYGLHCENTCHCLSCSCDHVTGNCSLNCSISNLLNENLVSGNGSTSVWLIILIITASLIIIGTLGAFMCVCRRLRKRIRSTRTAAYRKTFNDGNDASDEDL